MYSRWGARVGKSAKALDRDAQSTQVGSITDLTVLSKEGVDLLSG